MQFRTDPPPLHDCSPNTRRLTGRTWQCPHCGAGWHRPGNEPWGRNPLWEDPLVGLAYAAEWRAQQLPPSSWRRRRLLNRAACYRAEAEQLRP